MCAYEVINISFADWSWSRTCIAQLESLIVHDDIVGLCALAEITKALRTAVALLFVCVPIQQVSSLAAVSTRQTIGYGDSRVRPLPESAIERASCSLLNPSQVLPGVGWQGKPITCRHVFGASFRDPESVVVFEASCDVLPPCRTFSQPARLPTRVHNLVKYSPILLLPWLQSPLWGRSY